jgi:hypothetical protein
MRLAINNPSFAASGLEGSAQLDLCNLPKMTRAALGTTALTESSRTRYTGEEGSGLCNVPNEAVRIIPSFMF